VADPLRPVPGPANNPLLNSSNGRSSFDPARRVRGGVVARPSLAAMSNAANSPVRSGLAPQPVASGSLRHLASGIGFGTHDSQRSYLVGHPDRSDRAHWINESSGCRNSWNALGAWVSEFDWASDEYSSTLIDEHLI